MQQEKDNEFFLEIKGNKYGISKGLNLPNDKPRNNIKKYNSELPRFIEEYPNGVYFFENYIWFDGKKFHYLKNNKKICYPYVNIHVFPMEDPLFDGYYYAKNIDWKLLNKSKSDYIYESGNSDGVLIWSKTKVEPGGILQVSREDWHINQDPPPKGERWSSYNSCIKKPPKFVVKWVESGKRVLFDKNIFY